MADAETPPPAEPADESGNVENSDIDALEKVDTVVDATGGSADRNTAAPKKNLKQKLRQFNLYFVLFIFILLIGLGILAVAYFQSKQASTTSVLKTQTLTQNALQQVAASDATVGSSGTILNVQSSAVFAGKVLVRDGLEVGGNLQIGGTVSLNGITVSGPSQLGQLQVNKDLSVAGETALQGALTVAKTLQVSGTGNFSGPLSAPQITTSNLQLNSDLVLTHHIVAGGPTPAATRGSALGNGGSSSISGSDTTGTLSVNVGSGASSGCFASINFSTKFNSTPHVIVTPVGPDGGKVDFYVTRSATTFSICTATAVAGGSSFSFDYFVVN
ncbi:MAG: hypothetical protein QFB86_03775 [Patescibacteria group bacterium]|nr:hypothetical protein [Patescibacteria group bacterium]